MGSGRVTGAEPKSDPINQTCRRLGSGQGRDQGILRFPGGINGAVRPNRGPEPHSHPWSAGLAAGVKATHPLLIFGRRGPRNVCGPHRGMPIQRPDSKERTAGKGGDGGMIGTDAQHLGKRLYDARVPHQWAECGLEHLQLSGVEVKYKDGPGCTGGPGLGGHTDVCGGGRTRPVRRTEADAGQKKGMAGRQVRKQYFWGPSMGHKI